MESDRSLLNQDEAGDDSSKLIPAKKWEIKLFGYTLVSRYQNPWEFQLPSVLKYLLYLIGPRHLCRPGVPCADVLDRELPVKTLTERDFCENKRCFSDSSSVALTWLGHASCLFTFKNGVTVLCDPVFSQRASPVSWVGPLRKRDSPCTPEDLPDITAVCISHNHFDHMDRDTLKRLVERQPEVNFYVPKGDGWWMVQHCRAKKSQVHELEWWQSGYTDGGDTSLEIVFTPSSHWSGRNLVDKNRSLWGSFVIRCGGDTVYFAGDTGYQKSVFQQIGHHYGPMKLAAIPIGAYDPRDIFQAQHVSPKEAVKIHSDVRSNKSVGIHWGTFCLSTTEGLLQPKQDLLDALTEANLAPDCFVAVQPGATVIG